MEFCEAQCRDERGKKITTWKPFIDLNSDLSWRNQQEQISFWIRYASTLPGSQVKNTQLCHGAMHQNPARIPWLKPACEPVFPLLPVTVSKFKSSPPPQHLPSIFSMCFATLMVLLGIYHRDLFRLHTASWSVAQKHLTGPQTANLEQTSSHLREKVGICSLKMIWRSMLPNAHMSLNNEHGLIQILFDFFCWWDHNHEIRSHWDKEQYHALHSAPEERTQY